jgi:hypothetical protein
MKLTVDTHAQLLSLERFSIETGSQMLTLTSAQSMSTTFSIIMAPTCTAAAVGRNEVCDRSTKRMPGFFCSTTLSLQTTLLQEHSLHCQQLLRISWPTSMRCM